MQKIVPHLWFDKEAREAAEFYTGIFSDAKITNVTTIRDTPSGDCDIVAFELAGQAFMAISAGPVFKFTPAVSLQVKCRTKEEAEKVWGKLSAGGRVLMELGEYPFSEKYGWCNDKYGLSWQIMYVGEAEIGQKITPVLMFVGEMSGKAEEAVKFYTQVFHETKINSMMRYGKDQEPDREGTVKYAGVTLEGLEFGVMDSAYPHNFAINEAISFIVRCESQEEIDYYWERLSAVPEAEQCGWLKDKFGVSWQVVPVTMEQMLQDKDGKKSARVTQAFLKMKKIDIAKLETAREGNSN